MTPQDPSQQNQPVPPQAQPVAPPQMVQPASPDTNSFQNQQKVQYVVVQKSLEGLGGWLGFFVVIFALSVLAYVGMTFRQPAGFHTATAPLLAIGYLMSVIFIAMRKKAALWFVYGTLVLSFVVGSITTLVQSDGASVPSLVGSIVVSLLFHGLIGLYFYVSKRVKATLTR